MTTRIAVFIAALLFATSVKADLRVAAVGPMTGEGASAGEQIRRGVEVAVADINASGGLLGHKLVVEIGDDTCDPEKAVAIAQQMVDKSVALVVGHDCSETSIAASDVYHRYGVVQISPSSTNPRYTERGLDNVFRVCGRDDQQGATSGRYIAHYFRNENVAILHDNTTYGKDLANETRKAMNRLGKVEALYEAIVPGEKDYSAIAQKLKQANIGFVYFGGYYDEAGLILRAMRALGITAIFMSGDGLNTKDFWSVAGTAGEGVLMTFGPEPARNPDNKPIVDKFLKQGYKPIGYTLHAYAVIQAWAQAVERRGTTQVSDVVKVLKSGEHFDTVLGRIAFDTKGDISAPGFVVYQWSNGKFDYAKETHVMTIYSLPIIVGLIIFKLVLFIYAVRSRVKNARTWLFLCSLAALALFNISEIFLLNYFSSLGIDRALEVSGYAYLGTTIVAVAFLLHLSLQFALERQTTSPILCAIVYSPALLLECLLLFTDRVVAGFQPFQFAIIHVPGPWYFLFETYLTVYLAAALVNLLIAATNTKLLPIARIRNRLWLTALTPMALLMIYVIVSRYFHWPQISEHAYIPVAESFFLLVATYATYQYRLFDIEFYIPGSKVRERKTHFYRRIQTTIAELSTMPSMEAVLFRVSKLLHCPVALLGNGRPTYAVADGDDTDVLTLFPADTLNRIDRIIVADEIQYTLPVLHRCMRQYQVAAIVPFYPNAKAAASWMLFGNAFSATVHTPLDFRQVERLFDSLGEFFVDRLALLRTELSKAQQTVAEHAGVQHRIQALERALDREHDTAKTLRKYNLNLMMECHRLREEMVARDGNKTARVIQLLPKIISLEVSKTLAQLTVEFEKRKILDALARAGGNRSEAARRLGLRPNTLHYKMKRYGLIDDGQSE